jgi:CBS-domain-containing membrane protein
MLAKDVMSDGVMSVKSDATVLDAAVLMVDLRVSALPVLDDRGVMLGIVTEADLTPCAALLSKGKGDREATNKQLRARLVTEVMTRDVITIDENAPLKDVVALMIDKMVKRLPVRRGDAIVGIVSRIDLVRAIAVHADMADTRPAAAEDKGLRAMVFRALRGHSWSNAMNFDIAVDKGDVHLWGVVASEDEHMAYRKAAEAVPGVRRVVTHMHISTPGPTRPMPMPPADA